MGQIYLNSIKYSGTTGCFVKPEIYSLTEREIGVYQNGKPLYEKTIYARSISISENAKYTIESSFVGENVVEYCGYDLSGTTIYSLPDGRLRLMIEGGDLKLQSINGGTWSGDCYVTVRYTKAADTAGSGTWTSQGVPAVHYSTSEQVVGTWVDGKTLYQKTLPATWSTSNESIQLDFTPDTIFFVMDGSYKKDGTNNIGYLGYFVDSSNRSIAYYKASDNTIVCQAVGSNYTGSGYITVRYTKAST